MVNCFKIMPSESVVNGLDVNPTKMARPKVASDAIACESTSGFATNCNATSAPRPFVFA